MTMSNAIAEAWRELGNVAHKIADLFDSTSDHSAVTPGPTTTEATVRTDDAANANEPQETTETASEQVGEAKGGTV